MSRKPPKRAPQPDPSVQDPALDPELVEGADTGNGSVALEEETAPGAQQEEPAQVQLTIKGSDRSARAAAKRFGGDHPKAPAVATPSNDADEPQDPIAELLSDGKNMVLVTRQKPRTIVGPDGQEHATNVRISGMYTCPTSKAEVEELVFAQHGGSKYKCTIHPDTSDGANRILAHFTIEHPDSKCPPYIDGVTVNVPEQPSEENLRRIPNGEDPTARETDNLADLKARLSRRLDRAQAMKEIKELEKLARDAERDLENDGKPTSAQPSESDEVKKLKEQIAEKDRLLAEKKTDDRFNSLENSIKQLATAIAAKPATTGEDPTMKFFIEKMKSDDTRFTELMKAVTAKQAAPTAPPENIDNMIERFIKIKTLVGGNGERSKLSDLEGRLIDMALEKINSGGDDDTGTPEDSEDVAKLAVKQFAPILKTFVEKKMEQANAEAGGGQISKEKMQAIYAEAAQAAARKVSEDLAAQGIQLAQDGAGKLIAMTSTPRAAGKSIPPRKEQVPASKVVSERRTAEGNVKTVEVKPHDLSQKKAPPHFEAVPPTTNPSEGDSDVKYAELPMLGEGGGILKVELPMPPGDIKYDRKRNVNFILDSIRSEILQGIPKDKPNDSFVIGDAMELLDDEVLERISRVEDGTQMESILAEFGERTKIDEIKAAGEATEEVKVWLRRLVTTIGDSFRDKKKTG